jgi:hypothetical protein
LGGQDTGGRIKEWEALKCEQGLNSPISFSAQNVFKGRRNEGFLIGLKNGGKRDRHPRNLLYLTTHQRLV